ncbi:hypothetical protein [Nitrosomonas sp.]|uniref:type IV pilus assembly protein FimV n=1 Tax=Nitrosomonas sp. TaxID=42353 RepID=UPI002635A5C1|nr:hypothetical protein [Nitrosomonas sp.]
MVALISKLILVAIFSLASASVVAETAAAYSGQDNAVHKKATNRTMQWELLPGENILQIARLMFPKDSTTRDTFIRAVIRINPEHFPAGTYQPLPAGTVIHIPDLRTIHAYSAPTVKKRRAITANNEAQSKSPITPTAVISNLNSNHLFLQLISQLEQIAQKETHDLTALTQHTASLASRIAEIQSLYAMKTQQSSESQIANSGGFQEISLQPTERFEDPISPAESSDTSWENPFRFDSVFVLGILLMVLIVILILRNYRRIQERLTQPREASLPPGISNPHQYQVLFLDQNRHSADPMQNSPETSSSDMASEARLLIKQDNSEAAIQFLQKQLATNKFDISGWLLLFELLYALNNKSGFKKNARRFKRLGKFPDIWVQIQDLGYRLEPNESLYFNEQRRKEKFFPDSSDSNLPAHTL